jgi:hypothetical protein
VLKGRILANSLTRAFPSNFTSWADGYTWKGTLQTQTAANAPITCLTATGTGSFVPFASFPQRSVTVTPVPEIDLADPQGMLFKPTSGELGWGGYTTAYGDQGALATCTSPTYVFPAAPALTARFLTVSSVSREGNAVSQPQTPPAPGTPAVGSVGAPGSASTGPATSNVPPAVSPNPQSPAAGTASGRESVPASSAPRNTPAAASLANPQTPSSSAKTSSSASSSAERNSVAGPSQPAQSPASSARGSVVASPGGSSAVVTPAAGSVSSPAAGTPTVSYPSSFTSPSAVVQTTNDGSQCGTAVSIKMAFVLLVCWVVAI